MGIFSKMFGGGLPETKYDIIKRFAKIRMEKLKKTDSELPKKNSQKACTSCGR